MKKVLCACGCNRSVTYNDKKKCFNVYLKGHQNKKYFFNRNIFKKIKTEQDAYWLGFFAADGYVRDRGYFGFHLAMKDKNHLHLFLRYIDSNQQPKPYPPNGYRIEIQDTQYCKEILFKYGLIQGKSKSVRFPNIPDKLDKHFIRGVFDGDGWISTCKNKQGAFGIIGNKQLMTTIQNKLVKKTKINKTQLKKDKRHLGGWIRSITYGGLNNMKKIYKYLYNNHTICLNRKKKIWDELINRR